ncbi:MAG: hypothetical protein ACRCWR_11260 [Saezia sp.]
MKNKPIKLSLTVIALAFGVFLYNSYSGLRVSGSNVFVGVGILLILIGSASYLNLFFFASDEFRQSPSVLVYIVTVILFGMPQLLFGIIYIILISVMSFPFGLLTLHKTLPGGWAHISQALSWPGWKNRATSRDLGSEISAETNVNQNLKDSEGQKKNKSSPESSPQFGVIGVEPSSSAFPQEIKDYASYLESLGKK